MVTDPLKDFLDARQRRVAEIERCVDKGVIERPPIQGIKYEAFVVHPRLPGNLLALAIAHRSDDLFGRRPLMAW